MYTAINKGDSRNAAVAYFNLSQMFVDRSDLALAEENLIESVRMNRSLLGPDHADTLFVESYLARLYLRKGEAGRAEPLAAHTVTAAHALPVSWRLGSYLSVRGQCLKALSRFDESEAAFKEAIEVLVSTVGPD